MVGRAGGRYAQGVEHLRHRRARIEATFIFALGDRSDRSVTQAGPTPAGAAPTGGHRAIDDHQIEGDDRPQAPASRSNSKPLPRPRRRHAAAAAAAEPVVGGEGVVRPSRRSTSAAPVAAAHVHRAGEMKSWRAGSARRSAGGAEGDRHAQRQESTGAARGRGSRKIEATGWVYCARGLLGQSATPRPAAVIGDNPNRAGSRRRWRGRSGARAQSRQYRRQLHAPRTSSSTTASTAGRGSSSRTPRAT